jgi:cytochrome c oxidase subunit 1
VWPLVTAFGVVFMLVWILYTPWAFIFGAIPIGIGLVGWAWPRGPKSEAERAEGMRPAEEVAR